MTTLLLLAAISLHAPADTIAQRARVLELGRTERASTIDTIAQHLSASAATVRMEAANAVAQAAVHADGALARQLLIARLGVEPDAQVRGALFRSLGRLPPGADTDPAQLELILLQGSRSGSADAPPVVLEGITHGLASLYRRTAGARPASSAAIERLVELSGPRHPPEVRRQAMLALQATGRVDSGVLLDALADADWQVRRVAAAVAFAQRELPGRERIIRRALTDASPHVRYDALRGYGRFLLPVYGCQPVVQALDDADPHLDLLAVDLLGACGPTVVPRLRRLALTPATATEWHTAAAALVALARVDSAAALELLADAHQSTVWQVRMYAAQAAGQTGDTSLLARLAGDRHPNVQEAALRELRRLIGHQAAPLYLQALSSNDYQLVLTAAQALDSTPDAARALPVMFGTLERLTAQRRETSRDPRAALLAAIGTAGGPDQAARLRPFLRDFDPAIAEQAATVLTRWTGTASAAAPQPLSGRARAPTDRELAEWSRLEAVFEMDEGQMVMRLFPHEAPVNVARFVRMVRDRWFDGLTFHRVVPNFVVQGGSPGANEYMGDGPFTVDELGLRSHRRGTVGVSTRGRHTGDGQIFINLVDNLRLDHDYTIIGEMTSGLDVLDALLEGAVIRRVTLRPRSTP